MGLGRLYTNLRLALLHVAASHILKAANNSIREGANLIGSLTKSYKAMSLSYTATKLFHKFMRQPQRIKEINS